MSGRPARLLGKGSAPAIVPATGWSAPLTTVSAIATSFLAVLALAAGIAADRLAEAWRTDLAGLATVQVSAPPDRIETRVEEALAVLRTTQGIGSARVLSEAEHRALLAPWLGEAADLGALPAPRLIEVELEDGGPDPERLQSRLDTAAGGARFDDHAAWREPLADAAEQLERLAWTATALVALAAAGIVALAARATLSASLEVVRIVRLIGGEDRFIANAFVRRLAMRAFAGGALGSAAAGGALLALPDVSGTGVIALSLAPGAVGWTALLLGVPFASALVAWVTGRLTVRLALARMA